MYLTTGEAAKLLEIKPQRLRILLSKGRVKGAYKSGRFWIIPTYNGLPQIIDGKRGRKGTWKRKRQPKKTFVHINQNYIRQNAKHDRIEFNPVIAIKGKQDVYARNSLEIPFGCRIVYSPDKPLNCGAKVWIEILDGDIIAVQPKANLYQRSKQEGISFEPLFNHS